VDEQKLYTTLGVLEERLKNVQENTKDIPALATRLSIAEDRLQTISPKVDRHQKVMNIGIGVMGVFSVVWGSILAWIEGGHK